MLAFLCLKNSIPQMAKVMLERGMGLSAMSGCESFVLIIATPPPLTERIIVRNFLSNCWAKAILRSALAAQSTKLQSRHAPKWNVVVGIFLGNTFRFFHVPLVGSSPKPGSNNPPLLLISSPLVIFFAVLRCQRCCRLVVDAVVVDVCRWRYTPRLAHCSYAALATPK